MKKEKTSQINNRRGVSNNCENCGLFIGDIRCGLVWSPKNQKHIWGLYCSKQCLELRKEIGIRHSLKCKEKGCVGNTILERKKIIINFPKPILMNKKEREEYYTWVKHK